MNNVFFNKTISYIKEIISPIPIENIAIVTEKTIPYFDNKIKIKVENAILTTCSITLAYALILTLFIPL